MKAAPSIPALRAHALDFGAHFRALIAGLGAVFISALLRNPLHAIQLLLAWREIRQASLLFISLLEKIAAGEFPPPPLQPLCPTASPGATAPAKNGPATIAPAKIAPAKIAPTSRPSAPNPAPRPQTDRAACPAELTAPAATRPPCRRPAGASQPARSRQPRPASRPRCRPPPPNKPISAASIRA